MNNDFILMTDDSCDLPREYLEEHGIGVAQLSYTIDTIIYKAYDISPEQFYGFIRQGKMPVTTQVNVGEMREFMEELLRDGRDLLYIAFSSGLSGTCNSGMMAAAELREKYPGREIIVVDSLAASMGQGLIIYKAQKMRESGASIREVAKWVEDNRGHVAHLVAVSDLMHLHRGGRVSRMSAIAGSMLGIKPVIHVDDEGKLIVIDKVRGRKQSLVDIVDKALERAGKVKNEIFMVSHADCLDDARFVAELVTKRTGIKEHMINFIGPVIGSHTGLDVIALFMMAEYK